MYTTVYACGDRSPIPSRCIFCVSDEKKSELHEKEKKFKMHIIEILKMNLMKSKIMKWKWRCRI